MFLVQMQTSDWRITKIPGFSSFKVVAVSKMKIAWAFLLAFKFSKSWLEDIN